MAALPKDPAIRQRMNKPSTAATLPAEGTVDIEIPSLPDMGRRRKWHALTISWWSDTWRSPMAPEYLSVDIHGLYLLADLVDRYWKKPTIALAVEIRLQRQCFGLSPIDRRRLQWEVEKVEAVTRRRPPPILVQPAIRLEDDVRSALRAVK